MRRSKTTLKSKFISKKLCETRTSGWKQSNAGFTQPLDMKLIYRVSCTEGCRLHRCALYPLTGWLTPLWVMTFYGCHFTFDATLSLHPTLASSSFGVKKPLDIIKCHSNTLFFPGGMWIFSKIHILYYRHAWNLKVYAARKPFSGIQCNTSLKRGKNLITDGVVKKVVNIRKTQWSWVWL